jgi:hypothetical protein
MNTTTSEPQRYAVVPGFRRGHGGHTYAVAETFSALCAMVGCLFEFDLDPALPPLPTALGGAPEELSVHLLLASHPFGRADVSTWAAPGTSGGVQPSPRAREGA